MPYMLRSTRGMHRSYCVVVTLEAFIPIVSSWNLSRALVQKFAAHILTTDYHVQLSMANFFYYSTFQSGKAVSNFFVVCLCV
jgi:hypothetical protein